MICGSLCNVNYGTDFYLHLLFHNYEDMEVIIFFVVFYFLVVLF